MNSNPNGPITPDQLFNRLLSQNYKEAECRSDSDRYKEERGLLIQLIAEYETRIEEQTIQQQKQVKDLVSLKEQLLLQLETLKKERHLIQSEVTARVESLRVQRPVRVAQQDSIIAQVTVLRQRNAKLRVRIQELGGYMMKLQQQNMRLEGQRGRMSSIMIRESTMALPEWRQEMQLAKQAIRMEEADLHRMKKERQQATLRSIQAQQLQIKERNRQRMMRFKVGHPITPISDLERSNVYQSQYYRPN